MGPTSNRRARRHLQLAAAMCAALLLVTSCASGDDDAATGGERDDSEATGGDDQEAGTDAQGPPRSGPPSAEDVSTPTVEGPVTGGGGEPILGPPGFDLGPVGYVEEEFFLSGEAATYTSEEPLTEDGRWTVTPDTTADYTTRVVVRRPIDPAEFDGTVVVEWFNVSGGLDADPDWTYVHNEIIRSGSAWVGVSAQRAGIEGGGNSLGAALALKNADAERYGALDHPGDDHSYDIFSQAGAAVWFDSETLLDGLEPRTVVAMGESQSAFRLSTYVNAVAPLVDVYDGYLVHSRAAAGAPLAADAATPITAPDPTLSRTDLQVPVLVVSAETDLVGDRLGYGRARQPDSDWFASWEIAGTAHADAYNLGIGDNDDGSGTADAELFAAMQEPPSSVYFGVIECGSPINTGPHTYVVRSALAALVRWATEGEAPPTMPRLELDDTGGDVRRDELGNAVGGIRTPHVDVPIATLSGLGQEGTGFCRLFGTTTPLGADELVARYGGHDDFVEQWSESLDSAVESGAILDADAERLRSVVSEASIGL